MPNRKPGAFGALRFALTLAVLSAPATLATAQDRGATSAADEIKAMIAKYVDAVNREPVDLELASSVWENSPDATLIFPLGEFRGWDHIKEAFYQNVMEARFSERTLTPRAVEVHAYGDSGWAEFIWRFVAKSRKDSSRVETYGRETQIYRKTGPHHWVLVHVHYSSLSPAEVPNRPAP